MGAPGWTSFCANGHIVEVCPHHGIIFDEKTICDLCGAEVVTVQTEWGDDDYGPHMVPDEPIGHDSIEITRVSKYGKTAETIKIPIYDVSRALSKGH
jgi:hypothetical protein